MKHYSSIYDLLSKPLDEVRELVGGILQVTGQDGVVNGEESILSREGNGECGEVSLESRISVYDSNNSL